MKQSFDTLRALIRHGFDTVIDVRSPSEFAEDHVPGAINLPVLNDAERAQVGTIHKQVSPFQARKLGASKVFRNAADHIAGPLADHDGAWRPLVYCWRGGQRSGSFGWLLGQIGWRAGVIDGGYRTYRRLVHSVLYDTPLPLRLTLLEGYTGTAKTDVLQALAQRGVQTLDLEGMARHRGSLLGSLGDQPSQKAFESVLAAAIVGLNPSHPVVVEAESNKIGARIIPPMLWQAMRCAPRITLTAPIEARTEYLLRAYDDILSDGVRLRRQLDPLRAYRGNDVVGRWFERIAAGDKAGLTRALMQEHYDPSYAKSRAACDVAQLACVHSDQLDSRSINTIAAQIEAVLAHHTSETTPV